MNRPNIGVFRWSFRRFPHFVGKVVRQGRRKACACGHYVARFVRSALGGRTGSSPAAHATFSPRKFCGVEGGKEGREGHERHGGKGKGKGKKERERRTRRDGPGRAADIRRGDDDGGHLRRRFATRSPSLLPPPSMAGSLLGRNPVANFGSIVCPKRFLLKPL